MKGLGFLIGLAASAPADSAPPRAESVLLIPLEDRGDAVGPGAEATRAAQRALRGAGVEVRSARRLDLLEQARGCDYDVFCLVEVARLLEAERVLVGDVTGQGGRWNLRLIALDVERAVLQDTVAMAMEAKTEVVRAAAAVAAQRLAAPPSVPVRLRIEPPGARVETFGETLVVPPDGRLRLWPGRWRFELTAEGWSPSSTWIDLQPAAKEREIHLSMQPDPLAVRPAPAPFEEEPFGRPSRRHGSGVGVDEAGRIPASPPPPSRFARPLPWVTMGIGVLAAIGGAALMVDASGRYETLAQEPRFVPAGTSAETAGSERDDLRSRYVAGSITALSGAVLAAGGLGWLMLSSPPRATQDRVR